MLAERALIFAWGRICTEQAWWALQDLVQSTWPKSLCRDRRPQAVLRQMTRWNEMEHVCTYVCTCVQRIATCCARTSWIFYDRTENWVATGGAQRNHAMKSAQWNNKGRHWRCPNNRNWVATGGAQRNDAMKWNGNREMHMYSMTEQKTESPQAVPR